MFTSETTTRSIRIKVESVYDPQRSKPQEGQFFFLYTIEIANLGEETVRLLSRHWVITDELGKVEEVRGPGVVGEQPRLEPGEAFEYTSGCPLGTPTGTMQGSYRMVTDRGDYFDAEIAPFLLSEPYIAN